MIERPMESVPLPKSFHERLISAASVAVVVSDRDLSVIFSNPAAEAVIGCERGGLMGLSLPNILGNAHRTILEPLCRRVLQGQRPTQVSVHVDETPDSRELLLALSPLTDDRDEVFGVAAWVVDNTEARELSDRLAQAEKMASLGTLAGGVAHDFNNILGGVATFVDYALTSGDSVAMKRALQMTAEASARASKITQSLLSFAKHESLQPDLADLTEVILTFSHLVERPLQERHIELSLDVQPVPIVAVEANCMHQVLGHLLTNAEEAMPDGGRLDLSLRQVEDQIEVAFADTGCGIDSRNLSQVFEPFFTTKGLHAGGEHGNPGLGLSIVHG